MQKPSSTRKARSPSAIQEQSTDVRLASEQLRADASKLVQTSRELREKLIERERAKRKKNGASIVSEHSR